MQEEGIADRKIIYSVLKKIIHEGMFSIVLLSFYFFSFPIENNIFRKNNLHSLILPSNIMLELHGIRLKVLEGIRLRLDKITLL